MNSTATVKKQKSIRNTFHSNVMHSNVWEKQKCDWQISRSEKTTVGAFYIKNIRECHQVSSGGCCNQSTISVWVKVLHHMPHVNQFNGLPSQWLKNTHLLAWIYSASGFIFHHSLWLFYLTSFTTCFFYQNSKAAVKETEILLSPNLHVLKSTFYTSTERIFIALDLINRFWVIINSIYNFSKNTSNINSK